jgi:hypothetical protein
MLVDEAAHPGRVCVELGRGNTDAALRISFAPCSSYDGASQA